MKPAHQFEMPIFRFLFVYSLKVPEEADVTPVIGAAPFA